jgi:hypothetical protein
VHIAVSPETNGRRETFFRLLFGKQRGFVCIALLSQVAGRKRWKEDFFQYPDEMPQLLEHVNRNYPGNDIYFCPQLLAGKKRDKEHVQTCTNAWADLDTCAPEHLLVPPSITVESSPGRFQAYWIFEEPVEPSEAEDLSRRIAYYHAKQGADRSGWDLSQALRVPFTYNLKHSTPTTEPPSVNIVEANRLRYTASAFKDYPSPQGYEYNDIPFPIAEALAALDADEILQRFRLKINPLVWKLYGTTPEASTNSKGWSEILWQLEMLLFEANLTREEVFTVAKASACNKYQRDGKSEELLWKEVCRAEVRHIYQNNVIFPLDHEEAPLVSDKERAWVEANPSFVERYIEWAKGLGDAAQQYHQAGALVALSSLLAGSVRLPTSFGMIIPNLWFMILADTTLTRKSTAMDIAMDLIMELDPDAVLATDGSIEGLLTSLGTRPGRPSIFLRDEFSGLLEAIVKKDYYAGMPEMLTKLYDGKFQKRILRKEQIEVRDPVLILFAGGIRHKITSLLSFEHVASGFVPRFIFITAESDITKLRPIGPPTERGMGNRDAIKNELADMYTHYNRPSAKISLNGNPTLLPTTRIDASLTDDAWVRYNKVEAEMLKLGMEAEHPDLMTPTYDRLSKSMLKTSVLLAASRQRKEEVTVEETDIVRALYYMEGWRYHVQQVMNNVGKGTAEKQMDTILNAIERRGSVSRSVLMQNYHLTARDADAIFATLEQRGLIESQKQGKGTVYHARRKVTV